MSIAFICLWLIYPWQTRAVRWAAFFDDLEAQVEAARRAERAGEAADLTRLEVSRTRLVDRLRAVLGSEVTFGIAGSVLSGRLSRVGIDWALVMTGTSEVVVVLACVGWWSGLPRAADPQE